MGYNFHLVNLDTDSLSICKPDMTPFTKEEQEHLLEELNSIMPEKIQWEDDGYFDNFVVIKAKNYAMREGNDVKIKGNSLKATSKEKALQEMIDRVLKSMLEVTNESIVDIYHSYIKEIYNIQEINRWTTKKTITEKIVNPQRTNEQKVLDAIQGTDYQVGDKVYLYFDINENLKLAEYFNNDHHKDKLLEKVFATIKIFDTVLNMDEFLNYKLKRNKEKLNELLEE